MDVVAQHTCKGSRCGASPKNIPTNNAAEGILVDCCRDAWGHGMPPNGPGVQLQGPLRRWPSSIAAAAEPRSTKRDRVAPRALSAATPC